MEWDVWELSERWWVRRREAATWRDEGEEDEDEIDGKRRKTTPLSEASRGRDEEEEEADGMQEAGREGPCSLMTETGWRMEGVEEGWRGEVRKGIWPQLPRRQRI